MATHSDGMAGQRRLPAWPGATSDLDGWTGPTASATMAPLHSGIAGPAHDARSEYRADIRGAQP